MSGTWVSHGNMLNLVDVYNKKTRVDVCHVSLCDSECTAPVVLKGNTMGSQVALSFSSCRVKGTGPEFGSRDSYLRQKV